MVTTLNNLVPPVTGVTRSPSAFRMFETDGDMVSEVIMDLLCGRGLGLVVKRYLDEETCQKIYGNANRLMQDVRTDVPAVKLGADQFGKSTEAYFNEVEATSLAVASLFRGAVQVAEKLRFDIQRCLDHGMVVRRAQNEGRVAGDIRAANWTGNGAFSLGVHDDQAQLTSPSQIGFEIQHVRTPVAFNVYPIAEPNCGRLRIFNLVADENTKRRLNIVHTGYPYPIEALDEVPFIDVQIDPGDLVVLNGRYLHGVTSGGGARLLLNLFAGLLDDLSTVVTWT